MATSQAIIVDYQAGNVESVQRACDAVGIDALISADLISSAKLSD